MVVTISSRSSGNHRKQRIHVGQPNIVVGKLSRRVPVSSIDASIVE
jgi:hypothetical protein